MSKFMQQLRDPEADFSSAVLICREFFQQSLFQIFASFGAVAELLKHTVEALLRHPHADSHAPMQLVQALFDRASITESQKRYFASAVAEGTQWAVQPAQDRSIRVRVLMCGVTPWLTRDESEESSEASKVLQVNRAEARE